MGMASVLMCTACGFNFLRSKSIQKQMDAMSTEACAQVHQSEIRMCQTIAFHIISYSTLPRQPRQPPRKDHMGGDFEDWSFPCSDLQRQADDAKCPDLSRLCTRLRTGDRFEWGPHRKSSRRMGRMVRMGRMGLWDLCDVV